MSEAFSSDEHIPSFDASAAKIVKKGVVAPLYMYRSVLNTDDIVKWAKAQGFKNIVDPKELHVTVIYSKTPVDWFKMGENYSGDQNGHVTINAGGPRATERLGKEGAVVIMFASNSLYWRNRCAIEDCGASWDYDDYQPHITFTYDGEGIDLEKIEPYRGKIILGPEMFEHLDLNWKERITTTTYTAKYAKADKSLGLVFGWGIVCKQNGMDYVDLHNEHIPQDVMLKSVSEFMENSRVMKTMHAGEATGKIVHSFPLTEEIAKAFNIQSDTYGWMVAAKPDSDKTIDDFVSGRHTGFSIGGLAASEDM